jgi:large subunit ribosomal protein L4e
VLDVEAQVYQTNGSAGRKLTLPSVFDTKYNADIVRRALLAEQSLGHQPQGHYLGAGMETSASYTGRLGNYRTQRHIGLPPRPRQRLAKGAMGAVRRIPSSVKGRRAHPHHVEKTIIERINRKEYERALESAVAATADAQLVKQQYRVANAQLPLVVSSDIEKISKTKELLSVLKSLGISDDLERSHSPRLAVGSRRKVQRRYFRSSVVILAKDASAVSRACRNIPGVEALGVDKLRVSSMAPGAKPRLALWSEAALEAVKDGIASSVRSFKAIS